MRKAVLVLVILSTIFGIMVLVFLWNKEDKPGTAYPVMFAIALGLYYFIADLVHYIRHKINNRPSDNEQNERKQE